MGSERVLSNLFWHLSPMGRLTSKPFCATFFDKGPQPPQYFWYIFIRIVLKPLPLEIQAFMLECIRIVLKIRTTLPFFILEGREEVMEGGKTIHSVIINSYQHRKELFTFNDLSQSHNNYYMTERTDVPSSSDHVGLAWGVHDLLVYNGWYWREKIW